jgi:membrane-associated phospholipid phosphatase
VALLRAFSRLGEHGALWLALGLAGAGLDRARRDDWLAGARTVALAYAVNQAIKALVPRPRPAGPPLISTRSNRSFPSAHAATSFAGARAYRRLGLPAVPLYALAAAMAASRVALRVHHLSDVLAGAVLGTLIAR